MNVGDKNVVSNLRYQYGADLKDFTDQVIARAWREFSLSDEYPSKDNPKIFLEWVEMINGEAAPDAQ